MTTAPNYMREALDLARKGGAQVSPNPLVGAVLVRDGEVVGRGFHTWAGVKHAEILALEEAGERARGATLYITLEPCSHQGRTGPCADALIAAGVARVVAAMEDPNPLVRGRGLRQLRAAGIEVEIAAEFAARSREAQRGVLALHAHRPAAGDAEDRAHAGRQDRRAGRQRGWITSETARAHVQQLRHDPTRSSPASARCWPTIAC